MELIFIVLLLLGWKCGWQLLKFATTAVVVLAILGAFL